ncbi:hypothetical protein WICMUC_002464 [Wickerhamomyces mucosus]|uniref:Major facilitator superfamily (MFS) profile domain-containing protein n=1 Tax=Wickerhamomyces mucosus TaxID=1378264 RepID=A0A9P8PQY3_9ASCO|nr:hypothetical protein WICMUC_002464 [Wickerhamomyces mucosus]
MSSDEEYDPVLHFVKNHDKDIQILEEKSIDESIKDTRLPKELLKKIDWHIVPFQSAIYFLLFMDKALLNYAGVMGIKNNLKGNDFANLGTVFNATYIIGELVCGYLLQRFPLSKILSALLFFWGIVLGCHAAADTYASLMVVRVVLGFLESSAPVALIAINGQYYSKAEQAQRVGYYSTQVGTATIIGALLSFGFQKIHSRFAAYKILFLMFGSFSIVLGVLVYLYLPDNSVSAWFLTEEEKTLVVEHIRPNQTSAENKKFKWYQIKELLFHDKLFWLFIFAAICSQIVTGAVGVFSVSITATFFESNEISALLQIPIGALLFLYIVIPTQLIAKYGGFTWVFTSMYVPSVVGGILLIATENRFANLFGLYLIYSGSCAIVMFYVWNSNNVAGYTKKVFRNAFTMMAFSIANIIGPQLFQDYTYPRYMPAKITILATQAVSIPLTLLLGWLCKKENERRDKLGEVEEYQFLDLTDIENKNFRYMY